MIYNLSREIELTEMETNEKKHNKRNKMNRKYIQKVFIVRCVMAYEMEGLAGILSCTRGATPIGSISPTSFSLNVL